MLRSKKGFTLIELLIVVVIIGILAAIAIPKFAGTKSKAYMAAMKTDLKNFVLAEESYFTDYNIYGTAAQVIADSLFNNTKDVNLTGGASVIGGWAATTTHAGAPGKVCGVFVGSGTAPNAAVTNEGEVGCW